MLFHPTETDEEGQKATNAADGRSLPMDSRSSHQHQPEQKGFANRTTEQQTDRRTDGETDTLPSPENCPLLLGLSCNQNGG
jgi:hypothetical protein